MPELSCVEENTRQINPIPATGYSGRLSGGGAYNTLGKRVQLIIIIIYDIYICIGRYSLGAEWLTFVHLLLYILYFTCRYNKGS